MYACLLTEALLWPNFGVSRIVWGHLFASGDSLLAEGNCDPGVRLINRQNSRSGSRLFRFAAIASIIAFAETESEFTKIETFC